MMKNGKRCCRAFALLLAVLMCVSLLPAGIFADDSKGIKLAEGEAPFEHEHALEEFPGKEATCSQSGMLKHYYCETCDMLFDETGKEIADPQDLIIPTKEHEWDEGSPDPDDPLVIVYKCKNCGAEMREEVPEVLTPDVQPDMYKAGKTFTLNGYKVQFKTKMTKKADSMANKGRIDHIWIKAAKTRMTVNWKVNNAAKYIDEIIVLRKTGSEKVYKEVGRVPMKKNVNGELKWSPKSSFVDKTAKKKNKPYSYIVAASFNLSDVYYISKPSDWAAGQTTASKLKSVYTAKMNKKSADLQYKGTVQLKLKYAKPKKTYNAKSFRWYSDDKKIATVSSKGKVTARGVGETTIRGRLSSGHDITCKVSVVGAFKPGTPKLKVDVATNTSITLVWNKTKYATSYDLYRSNDGLHWKDENIIKKIKGTSKKVTGLTKGHRYTFYVVARNDNNGYSAKSTNSNVVNQKAIMKRRPTVVTGFPKKKTLTSGTNFILSLTVTSPDGRRANLQMLNGKKWVTKKTVTLPKGAGKTSMKLLFTNDWWGKTTSWRFVIPRNNTSEEYVSPTLKITGKRLYQNPSSMIQVSNSISKHGFKHYVVPVLVNNLSNRSACVEALIKTANKYKGDKYVPGRAGAPGYGIDDGGLVIQACYGGGIDLWPVSPSTRNTNAAPAIMSAKLEKITNYGTPVEGNFPNVYRGDLIFFYTGQNNVGHVAIYLGLGKVIHASSVTNKVETTTLLSLISKKGKYKYKIAGVRRVYHMY